jgi:putative tricarboxylic transport membrane protein
MSRRRELAASLVFLAFGVGVCIGASRLGFGSVHAPEPGFFPWTGGLMLVGLSVCLFVQALRGRSAVTAQKGEWLGPGLLLAALVLYVPFLEPLGYPVTTTALCVVALRVLKTGRWSVTLGVSVALAMTTYLLFRRVLGVELPPGVFWF